MSLIDDAALLKMAEAEILEDARKAAFRHSVAGISGWQPCPKPNKVFLTNVILQNVTSNRILSLKGRKPAVKHKNIKRKLIKKDEKINITYQAPKKEEKQLSVNSSKIGSDVKSRQKPTNKLMELSNKINRERIKTKRFKWVKS